MKFSLTLLLVLSFSISCGRKAKNTDSSRDVRYENPVLSDLPDFIKEQKVICEDFRDCPAAISRIVVMNKGEVSFCTGLLIGPTKMITSASCLPRSLQVNDLNCDDKIFSVFPDNLLFKGEIARCKKITYSTVHEEADPALWRQDLTVIELSSPVFRKTLFASSDGISENTFFDSFFMTSTSDYEGVIQKKKCFSVFNSYANPLSLSSKSPSITFSGCPLEAGNKGGAVLNERGELVAFFSSNLLPEIENYLKQNKLVVDEYKGAALASNFACSIDEINPGAKSNECNIKLNSWLLRSGRYNLLHQRNIHKKEMASILESLKEEDKYFKFEYRFKLVGVNAHYALEVSRPLCFFDKDSWIEQFRKNGRTMRTYAEFDYSYPRYELRLKLDKNLKIFSEVTSDSFQKFILSFNPKNIEKNNYTSSTLSFLDDDGEVFDRRNFVHISDNCLF